MKRREILRASLFAPLTMAASSQAARAHVIDGMGEIRVDYEMELIDEVLASGMTAVQVTAGTPSLHGEEAFEDAVKELADYEHYIDTHRDRLLKATRVADLDRARDEKRLALLYQFQNAAPIADKLDRLDLFYRLGVRCVQLTYNSRNLLGNGCMERTDEGLSDFGIEVVEKMNAMGMLVDVSHSGPRTTDDAVRFSKEPIAFNHSSCASVFDHPRAKTDAQLRALADKGGVIGIFQLNPSLGPKERNTLDDYLNHVDHAVRVAGIDHVGIGSDREHRTIPDTDEERQRLENEMARIRLPGSPPVQWPFFLSELNHPRRMETLRSGLEGRRYRAADIDKILGGNFYRLYRDVLG
jgi:membrane dipeptidase